MAGTMRDLAAFCDKLPARIKAASNERKKQIVLAIEQELTQSTPIDTGAAISNWQVGVGEAPGDVIGPYVPSRLGFTDLTGHSRRQAEKLLGNDKGNSVGLLGLAAGDGGTANAQAAMDVARTVVETAQQGDTIYIANNVPYIQRLNVDGTSPQAAPGFVERAIISGRDAAERAKFTV